jgi:hypothetical protein
MSEHWLQHAHGRIVAGDDELDVLADYGWVQITAVEREAITMAVSACDVEASLNVACDGRQSFAGLWSDRSATLRKLLERLA